MKSIGIYIIRGISLLFAVTIFAFILASVSPVDPIRQYIQANPGVSEENVLRMEEYWGLNDPPVQRYGKWLSAVLHVISTAGDSGNRVPFQDFTGTDADRLDLLGSAGIRCRVPHGKIQRSMARQDHQADLPDYVFNPDFLDWPGVSGFLFRDPEMVSFWDGSTCGYPS